MFLPSATNGNTFILCLILIITLFGDFLSIDGLLYILNLDVETEKFVYKDR